MSIHVSNLESGETLTYSLALLAGEVTPPLAQSTMTVGYLEGGHPQALSWPVHNGQFKALVPLQPGQNILQLKFYDETQDFILHYTVPEFTRFVRPIYLVAAGDDGYFQGPDNEDCSPDSALRRISLGAKLLQTFTAEKLHEHGLGRRTFLLETDLYPDHPPCYIFRTKLKVEEAYKMTGGDLWMYFARELMSSKLFLEKDNCKWYTFMSFTKYCPPEGIVPKSHSDVLKHTKGHTALGGGGLALFGTGNLHTWSDCLEDVVTRFTDARKVDRTKFMDDSAYRQTHWANYSTGLGASLHELGHTFDLAHTPTGVMARGFDDLYRVFTVQPLVNSRCSSRDSSHLASPIPYSPKQSPVHRPRLSVASGSSSSRSGSPKPCPPTRPAARFSLGHVLATGGATVPAVVQIETAFKRLRLETSQTFTIENYDGSKTKKTVMKHKDGTETVTEITSYSNGERIAREVIRNLATGKTRTTMSMSTSSDALSDLASPAASIKSAADLSPSAGAPHPAPSTADAVLPGGGDTVPSAGQTVEEVTPSGHLGRQEHLGGGRRGENGDGSENVSFKSSFKPETSVKNGGTLEASDKNNSSNGQDQNQKASQKPPGVETLARENGTRESNGHRISHKKTPSVGAVPASTDPDELPRSPDEGSPLLTFQEVQYKDGGAHWYRASAVLLGYHKWFNPHIPADIQGANPELKGNILTAPCGLRLIELRSLPDSVVFHHWEFLHKHPPTQFPLSYSNIMHLSQQAASITVVAEDNNGNIFKKKIQTDSLKLETDEVTEETRENLSS